MDLADAAARVVRFAGPSLSLRIAAIEHSVRGMPTEPRRILDGWN